MYIPSLDQIKQFTPKRSTFTHSEVHLSFPAVSKDFGQWKKPPFPMLSLSSKSCSFPLNSLFILTIEELLN